MSRAEAAQEITFYHRGDFAYTVVEGPTWEEALANAEDLGGSLVSSPDVPLIEWLMKTFNSDQQWRTTIAVKGEKWMGQSDITLTRSFWIRTEKGPSQPLRSSISWTDDGYFAFNPDNFYPNEQNPNQEQVAFWNHNRYGIAEVRVRGPEVNIDRADDSSDKEEQVNSAPDSPVNSIDIEAEGITDPFPGRIEDVRRAYVRFSSLIQGSSARTDAVTGSDAEDVLGAGKGADKLTGGDGADQFVFYTPERFGKRGADTITDFKPEQGDTLILITDALPGLSNPELTTVNSQKALRAAQKSAATLIYNKPLGQLFYDQNGSGRGFGKGGLFAILSGAPELTANDLGLLG
jgi:hypothetical protein